MCPLFVFFIIPGCSCSLDRPSLLIGLSLDIYFSLDRHDLLIGLSLDIYFSLDGHDLLIGLLSGEAHLWVYPLFVYAFIFGYSCSLDIPDHRIGLYLLIYTSLWTRGYSLDRLADLWEAVDFEAAWQTMKRQNPVCRSWPNCIYNYWKVRWNVIHCISVVVCSNFVPQILQILLTFTLICFFQYQFRKHLVLSLFFYTHQSILLFRKFFLYNVK